MTTQSGPYVRVYYSIIDDDKFEGIYTDDAALAAWLRLLLTADAIWPASASLPRSVKRGALAKLVAAGLVDLDRKDNYRIHGLDAERGGRKEAAVAAAAARWGKSDAPKDAPARGSQSKGNAGASDDQMPLRAEPSSSSPSQAEPSQRGASPAVTDEVMPLIRMIEDRTGRPWAFGQGNKTLDTLRYDVRDFGAAAVGGALSAVDDTHDAAVLVWSAHKLLNPMSGSRSAKRPPKGMTVSDAEADRAFDA